MSDKRKLTQQEQIAIEGLKQDAIRLTKRNDTILKVIAWLEKVLKENERLKEKLLEVESYASGLESEIEDLQRELESLD